MFPGGRQVFWNKQLPDLSVSKHFFLPFILKDTASCIILFLIAYSFMSSHQCAGWKQGFIPDNLTEDPNVEESFQRGDSSGSRWRGAEIPKYERRSMPFPRREENRWRCVPRVQGDPGPCRRDHLEAPQTRRDVTPAGQMQYQSRKDE